MGHMAGRTPKQNALPGLSTFQEEKAVLRFMRCPRCREKEPYQAVDVHGLYAVCVLCGLVMRDQATPVRHSEGLHPLRCCA